MKKKPCPVTRGTLLKRIRNLRCDLVDAEEALEFCRSTLDKSLLERDQSNDRIAAASKQLIDQSEKIEVLGGETAKLTLERDQAKRDLAFALDANIRLSNHVLEQDKKLANSLQLRTSGAPDGYDFRHLLPPGLVSPALSAPTHSPGDGDEPEEKKQSGLRDWVMGVALIGALVGLGVLTYWKGHT